MPRLSIIVVTYNSAGHVAGCLDSLAAHPPAVGHEVVIVDNASVDGTTPLIRARWPGVRVIEAAGNVGFAGANNIGMRATQSELVLLLNPDTIAPAGAIDTLVAALGARPDAAIAGPRLVDGSGRPEISFGPMIGPFAELRQKTLGRAYDRGLPPFTAYVRRLTRRPREVDWVSGACLLVRRADAVAAGLMDERFFMYTEDVDFCATIRARGRKVLFAPAAEIVHLRGRSAATSPGPTAAAYRRSQIAFYEKHHPHWAGLLRRYLRLRGQI